MTKKMIVGNWKQNPKTLKEARAILAEIVKQTTKPKKTEAIFCVPAVFLAPLVTEFGRSVLLGAQDCSTQIEGAYTGEISAYALSSVGATHVIIGHSERRAAGETDDLVATKLKLALKAGLKVILCIGEEIRDEHGVYLKVLERQLHEDLAEVSKAQLASVIVAYEPVWAVGKNASGVDTPENFLHNAIFIRKVITDLKGGSTASNVPILYGGSVNIKNAASFLVAGQADGLLIGRESLKAVNISRIINEADAL